MLSNIRVVLLNTSHPGNIGAAARAMKTMGLEDLRLVNPKQFPHAEATARASGNEVPEVERRELPELDDEFAKDLGEFDDLEALKARIREDLEARKKRESEMAVRQGVLDKLLLENPIVLPETLVEDEIRQRLEEMVRRMMMQGMDPEQMQLDWKELRKQQEEPARKSVHARLLLDARRNAHGDS